MTLDSVLNRFLTKLIKASSTEIVSHEKQAPFCLKFLSDLLAARSRKLEKCDFLRLQILQLPLFTYLSLFIDQSVSQSIKFYLYQAKPIEKNSNKTRKRYKNNCFFLFVNGLYYVAAIRTVKWT